MVCARLDIIGEGSIVTDIPLDSVLCWALKLGVGVAITADEVSWSAVSVGRETEGVSIGDGAIGTVVGSGEFSGSGVGVSFGNVVEGIRSEG